MLAIDKTENPYSIPYEEQEDPSQARWDAGQIVEREWAEGYDHRMLREKAAKAAQEVIKIDSSPSPPLIPKGHKGKELVWQQVDSLIEEMDDDDEPIVVVGSKRKAKIELK